jgi:Glycosyl transferase family 2
VTLTLERPQTSTGHEPVSTGHEPSFSFLIPTHREDRPLARCLDSVAPQLGPNDEVVVIGDTCDGPLPRVRDLVRDYGPQFLYLEHDAGYHDWGHSQLQYGIGQALGEWLHCNDDDDVYVPGAVAVMRTVAADANGRPILFRFRSYHGQVYWAQRGVLQMDLVGGHCLVFPNIPGKIGRFGRRYQGDWDMIDSTVRLHGGPDSVIWRTEIICIARPDALP